MSRRVSDLLDFGIEDESDPKFKLNSLISVTVSTLMCIAAKCPLPKSNVESTKQFLSSIADDNIKSPRNIKGFLSILDNYTGPYEDGGEKEKEKPVGEKPKPEKEEKPSLEMYTCATVQMVSKESRPTEVSMLPRRCIKPNPKKSEKPEKEQKKCGKKPLKSSPSKSTIGSKS